MRRFLRALVPALALAASCRAPGGEGAPRDDLAEAREVARTAPLDRFSALVIGGERPVLGVVAPDGRTLVVSTTAYDELSCFDAGEACVARNGGLCGLVLKRTGRAVVPVEHPCEPRKLESWQPCEGLCVRFADGARFVVKDGVARAVEVAPRPAPPAP
jgi:hypothetical protein